MEQWRNTTSFQRHKKAPFLLTLAVSRPSLLFFIALEMTFVYFVWEHRQEGTCGGSVFPSHLLDLRD